MEKYDVQLMEKILGWRS